MLGGTPRQATLQTSLEEARLDAISKPALPDSDLSVTSDGEIRTHASISANSNTPSSSPQLDRNAESEKNQRDSAIGQSTGSVQSESSESVHSPQATDADGFSSGREESESSETKYSGTNPQEAHQDQDTGHSETSKKMEHAAVECDSKQELELDKKQTPASDSSTSAPRNSDQLERPIQIDDISLHSRSTSPLEEVKIHPLSVLTSDSEAEEDPIRARRQQRPLYSPIPNTSGKKMQCACTVSAGLETGKAACS